MKFSPDNLVVAPFLIVTVLSYFSYVEAQLAVLYCYMAGLGAVYLTLGIGEWKLFDDKMFCAILSHITLSSALSCLSLTIAMSFTISKELNHLKNAVGSNVSAASLVVEEEKDFLRHVGLAFGVPLVLSFSDFFFKKDDESDQCKPLPLDHSRFDTIVKCVICVFMLFGAYKYVYAGLGLSGLHKQQYQVTLPNSVDSIRLRIATAKYDE